MEKTLDTKSVVAVRISPDRMKAHVVLPRDPTVPVGPDDLRAALSGAGVRFGIREDLFEKICAQPRNGLPLLIASGKPPERGKDGQIEFLIPTERTHKPQVDEHGKANWYEMNLVNNVQAGQVLARMIPPTHGEPGMTVLGEELRGLLGNAVVLPVGINTQIAKDDPHALVAKEAGGAVYDRGKIHVMTTYEIAGSVDFDTGNVTTVASVKVMGDVKSGFAVKSGGNVEVRGFVEDATIIAEGNILIKGGFVGSGLGRLVAGKDVVVHYIENQTVEAGGNVRIEKHALNANIETRGKVIFLHPLQGQLIGGQTTGIEGLELGSVGNENETRTEIRAGASAATAQDAARLQEDLDTLRQSLEQTKNDIVELADKKYKTGLSPEDEERFVNLRKQKKETARQIEALQKQLEEQLAEITQLGKATIRVHGKIHNNVGAFIGRFIREFESPRERVILRVRGGSLVVEPLI